MPHLRHHRPLPHRAGAVAIGLAIAVAPVAATAQDGEQPRRTRVIVGPAVTPAFPGADRYAIRPYVDLSRTRASQFDYEAPDESTSIALIDSDGFSFGPAIGFEGKRRARDAGGLDEVKFSVELGGAVAYRTGNIRFLAEARKGVSGHKAVTGMVGVDYIARDADKWLFAIGPRVTFADNRYARRYFGVTAAEALRTGVPAFTPDGGVTMVGGTASLLRQFGDGPWGVFGFAKYDRLIGDAADSPVVRRFGSRGQLAGGVGISYTFGGR
ncbi:MipA/OmpV family protein [Sphingomonas sp.]|uniref:MipA/OmpV family protein n=1 Tax=Sphingomonas sp. TaxID=28214 RepID=UPI002DD6AC6F|nr:MipA/OmpV family protein [Sphingomonas sp.]